MAKIDVSKLVATELDELISEAAKRRAALQPAVPNDPPKQVDALFDPRWFTVLQDENTILQIQHPGFGWITYVIPPHERANLLTVLLRQALTPPQTKAANIPMPSTSAGGGAIH